MQPRSLHPETKRRRKGFRRKGILWEYNGDGGIQRERIKGFWKCYWKRWTRRQGGLFT